jgi:Amt family ammonium transporter
MKKRTSACWLRQAFLSVPCLQLCAGAIRSKNTMNILLQTILDAAVSAIAFYLVG